MVKDILTFDSSSFSLEPPIHESGVHYDLPLGDDIATFLKERLERKDIDLEIDDPVREDFGAVLMLEQEKKTFTVTISWQGENSWAMVFNQMRGLFGWLFNRKPEERFLNEIKHLVNMVVVEEPERFTNIKWIASNEFTGVASAFVIPE